MTSLLLRVITTFLIVELVLGLVGNGFIALVNCIDWVKRKKISTVDLILTSLALSRIGLLWVIILSFYATMFSALTDILKVRASTIAWLVTNHVSMWFATCLSIFYLLKIANFSNLIFLHLKRRAERLILVIMLGTLIILSIQLAGLSKDVSLWKQNYEGNMTLKIKLHDSNLAVFHLAVFLPFTTSLASLLLLIFSLGKHLKKMRHIGRGHQDPSTEAHIKAMHTVVSFLLLFVTYFLSLTIASWSLSMQYSKQILMFCQALEIIYPSSHPFMLILVNQKLKRAFLSAGWQLKYWLR